MHKLLIVFGWGSLVFFALSLALFVWALLSHESVDDGAEAVFLVSMYAAAIGLFLGVFWLIFLLVSRI